VTVLGKATGIVLSIREPVVLGSNVSLPPGLYRGVRTTWPKPREPDYKIQLSTFLREHEFDVTALVKSGLITEK